MRAALILKIEIGHFRVAFCLCVKTSFARNHSTYDNEFRPQVHFHVNQTHFHMKGFARGLVLKQRHKVTWKWPIIKDEDSVGYSI